MEITISLIIGTIASVVAALAYSILIKFIAFKKTKLSIKLPGVEISFDPSKPEEISNIVNSYISDPQVFIAYAHKDKEKARSLASALKGKGLRIWLDEHQINLGDNIRSKIDEGLNSSGYLIAMLSKASVESKWVQNEFQMALERERSGKWPKVIPVLVEDTELPEYIKDKMYLDLRNGVDESIDQLVNVIKHKVNESNVETP